MMRNRFREWLVGLLVLALALGGCVTKAKAKAQARAAYLAGQQEAMARMQQQQLQLQSQSLPSPSTHQPQMPTVTIYGDVQNPIIPWTLGLTLAQAIVKAGYPESATPAAIYIVRNGVAKVVDLQALAGGSDVPLQPGDLVHIKQAGTNNTP